jgi:hypothetical protein
MITINRTAIVVRPGQPYWIREEQLDGWHCIPASWLSRFHAVVVDFCDAPPLQEI